MPPEPAPKQDRSESAADPTTAVAVQPTTLTDCDPLSVRRIQFDGPAGHLILARPAPGSPLLPIGQDIPGFDERTAALIVATACGLRALERAEAVALSTLASTTVTIELGAGPPVVVTIGNDDPRRRLTEVAVSTRDGVFFVPRHVTRALRLGPQRLSRTPERVAQDEAAARAGAAHAELHRAHDAAKDTATAPSPASPWGRYTPGQPVAAPVRQALRALANRPTQRQAGP